MGNQDITTILLLVFASSFVVSGLIWATKSLQMTAIMRRADTKAVQASHTTPTPRLGGIAVVAGLVVASVVIASAFRSQYVLFLTTLLPVFVSGLLEDLGYNVRPRMRLVASAMSSVLVMAIFGIWVDHVGVIGLDTLLGFVPVAILFTIFATVGVSNAFNLIDGLNGLAVSTAMMTAAALSVVAHQSDLMQVEQACYIVIFALGGFLFFNYPFGKVFLGDGGAYSVGHVLVWISVGLMWLDREISPAAILLIFFWPVADTFLAIFRRRSTGRNPEHPDRLHFHQLLMRALEIAVLGRKKRKLANPLTTAIMLPLIAAPQITGVMLVKDNLAAIVALFVFSVIFFVTYRGGILLARTKRIRRFP